MQTAVVMAQSAVRTGIRIAPGRKAPVGDRPWARTRGWKVFAYQPTAAESQRHVGIAETLQLSGLHWVDWVSLRHEPDLLFAGDRRVFWLPDYARVPEERYFTAATPLVDFRDMAFEQVRPPPSAMQW